jgi:hypothetical protein
MVTRLILVTWALAATLQAQTAFDLNDPAFLTAAVPNGKPFHPTNIAGCTLYWDYRSLTASVAASSWADKIQNFALTEGYGPRQPTNTANGLYFWDVNAQVLANASQIGVGVNWAVWIVFRLPADTASYGTLLAERTGIACFYVRPGQKISFYYGGDHFITDALALNTTHSLAYNNMTGACYTNGIAAKTVTPRGVASSFGNVGSDWGGSAWVDNYKGYIKFIGVWTNISLTAQDAASLTTYANSN